MKIYESIIILNPNATEDEVDTLIESFKGSMEALKGEVLNVEKWGKRNLAYEVLKHRQGNFILFQMRGAAVAIDELSRRCRITESVIRHQTVCLTEKQYEDWITSRATRRSREEAAASAPAAEEPAENEEYTHRRRESDRKGQDAVELPGSGDEEEFGDKDDEE